MTSFGFEDGVSQPLLKGIDKIPTGTTFSMETPQKIITVVDPTTVGRPDWMADGSFLVFRKLEQDVAGFNTLVGRDPKTGQDLTTVNFTALGCKNSDHLGAKLMGRWKSGMYFTNLQVL